MKSEFEDADMMAGNAEGFGCAVFFLSAIVATLIIYFAL